MSVKSLRSISGRLLLLLLLCLAGSELITQIPAIDTFNQSWIDAHTRDNGIHGVANFILIATALVTLGAPRQLTAFLGGYAFGFLNGTIYSTIAVTLSCLLTVQASRLYARPIVSRFFDQKIQSIDRFLRKQSMLKTIIIRLLPIGNNLITNLVVGITTVKLQSFLIGSMIGYLPQMVIFSLMGKGVMVQSFWKILLSVLLLGISSGLSIYLYKKYKADKLLESQSSDADSPFL